MEEILLLNKLFSSDRRYMSSLRRCSPTKLWDGAQLATFGDFLGPAFPASHVQHISDLHSKFALRPQHVQSMVNIQSLTAEIRRGKKEEERNRMKLECGPMPNLMVALPNIGGALCSTPQSLADAHY